jgi:hypothetical protein
MYLPSRLQATIALFIEPPNLKAVAVRNTDGHRGLPFDERATR